MEIIIFAYMNTTVRILLLAILLLVAGLSAHAQTGIYAVTAQELNIRRGPGKDYSVAGIMQRVPGGTAHWLFRRMVLRDLGTSIRNIFR